MALPTNIVTKVSEIIRYDLATYLNLYVSFIENDRTNIFDYYSGNVKKANQKSFARLTSLLKESDKVDNLIDIHKHRMATAEFWELIELLTSMTESLLTIDNSSKWLRSVITKNNFSPEVEVELVLNQLQTLENLSKTVGSVDVENDWIKIALRNDLAEEDYTTEGGNVLSIAFRNKLKINIQSIVDNIDGEKIYGIDINKQITFIDDDLQALSYQDTIKQTVDVLANLRMGHTPEFPLDGVQSKLVVGSNRNSVAYPILFRQLYSTFQKDDTLKSFAVKKIENTEDILEMDFEVETRFGEVVPTKTAF